MTKELLQQALNTLEILTQELARADRPLITPTALKDAFKVHAALQAAIAQPVPPAEPPFITALINSRRERYAVDQTCTPAFLHWIDTQAREGVGANEAWNAGYACAEKALAQPVPPTTITWNADGVRTVNGIPDYVAQPVPKPVAWRHSLTYALYDEERDVPLGDGDEWAEPLYLGPQPVPPAAIGREVTDAELTAIYDTANGHAEGKLKPITTLKIFTAMRACLSLAQPAQPALKAKHDQN